MIQIINEIDAYVIAYNLPPLEITNHQWDLFFDNIYSLFLKKSIEKNFYELMSQLTKLTFSKSLLNDQSEINIYNLIENLYYLENKEITKKDILLLQQKLFNKLRSSKIINFSDYEKKEKLNK